MTYTKNKLLFILVINLYILGSESGFRRWFRPAYYQRPVPLQNVGSPAFVQGPSRISPEYLQSPCPDSFGYTNDDNGDIIGAIEVYPPAASVVTLYVEFLVGNPVQGYNGKIEVAMDRERLVANIVQGKPIYYKLLFPYWTNIPPRITKIAVNGNTICSGPKVFPAPLVTTIKLQHKLTLSLPPGGNNQKNSGEESPSDDGDGHDYQNNPFLNNYFNKLPTTETDNNNIVFPTKGPASQQQSSSTNNRPHNVFLPELDNIPGNNRPTQSSDNEQAQRGGGNAADESLLHICGIPVNTNPLIVNGKSVPRGAFPWLAAIFHSKYAGLDFKCGGTLITKKHVVTAAHCVTEGTRKMPSDQILIVLGRLNINSWSSTDGGTIMDVANVIVHPEYKPLNSHADISIVLFKYEVNFNTVIRPICLWNGPNDLDRVVGMTGTVVGWGRDENGNLMTPEARQTSMPIVSQEDCLRSKANFEFSTSNMTFCAGYRNGSGPCNGDSGGGFSIQNNDRWMLRGVVSTSLASFDKGTCDLSNYIVFCDVSKYRPWIIDIIK